MSPSEKKSTYLEFEDPDDSKSDAYESSEKKSSFRIKVQPEMYLMAMVEAPDELEPDVLPAVRELMYASYLQGKRVGQKMEKRKLSDAI